MREPEHKTRTFCTHVKAWAQRFGLVLPEALCEKLSEHYALLLRWNERINLTRIVEPEEAARFHYVESLYGERFLDPSIQKIVDVGSGGGFPGIPLALARPDTRVVLIEKDRKRAIFLLEAIRQLGLRNADVFHGRFEAYGHRDFDGLTCRALERMREKLPDLLAFAEGSAQVLLFGESALENIIRCHTGILWEIRSIAIPYSQKRQVFLLRRSNTAICST